MVTQVCRIVGKAVSSSCTAAGRKVGGAALLLRPMVLGFWQAGCGL